MSLVAEFSVESSKLSLYNATTAVPSITVELTTQIATDPERPLVFFWARGERIEAFDDALRTDDSVTDVETYTDLDTRRLYRAQVSDAADLVAYPVWVEAGAERLEAICQNGTWRDRFRFPDREALRSVRQWCRDNGVTFKLHSLYAETGDIRSGIETRLSPEQAKTLETAYRAGYFEIPREATAADVAAELEISPQSVSERLRRAYAALVEDHVLPRTE